MVAHVVFGVGHSTHRHLLFMNRKTAMNPEGIHTLALDIETYSPEPITNGVYKYTEHPDFQILLCAYSINDGPVEIVDLDAGEKIPAEVIRALTDDRVIKYAFNANFERVCLSRHLKQHHRFVGNMIYPTNWRCTMVWALATGLPGSLDGVGKALNLDAQKIAAGKDLIRFFCLPGNPREAAQTTSLFGIDDLPSGSLRRRGSNHPEKWEYFKAYCVRDVEVETEIRRYIEKYPLPDWLWKEYEQDQIINDTGVGIDLGFATAAIRVDDAYKQHCLDEMQELTGLANPNSPTQIKNWLADNGCAMDSLAKLEVQDALTAATGTVKRVLELRQELSRSSVKKYQAMLDGTNTDGRARGLLQFCGAGRTGRWAGRRIQVQNLPRNYAPDLDTARKNVATGDADVVEMLWDSVPDMLSQLIRTSFTPAKGHKLIVADFSAIEARVLAWLAGEEHTLQAFREGKDLYCVTASKMFGVPVDKHGPNADLRQKGKVAVLACGYQGGAGALEAMGALRMGIPESELKPIVDAWRDANPNIVRFWWHCQQAAIDCLHTPGSIRVGKVTFEKVDHYLTITLPSGRVLYYPHARVGKNRFGGESIEFMGQDQQTRRWVRLETYGGKLVENITQAVARDVMGHALRVIRKQLSPIRIVMHIHDEVVVDTVRGMPVSAITEAMAVVPEWASCLPLDADGYECDYYKKD